MRVLTFSRGGEERAGLLVDDTVYDIETCSSFFGMPVLPPRLLSVLEDGSVPALRSLDESLRSARRSQTDLPLSCWAGIGEVRILAPIPRPPKIVCMSLNYRDHAAEQGAKLPETPLVFAKATSAVVGSGHPIVIPRGSVKVDYEGELAFVVGKRLRRAGGEEAAEGIFGYCIMNDVTDREAQKERVWFRAKGADTFAPMGPWVVTADEIRDPLDLRITTKVNDQVRQAGSTKDMIFTPVDILTFLTNYITLEPGDVVSTGTPSGVGVFRDPPVFLKRGDVVDVTVEAIGTLTNPVTSEP